MKESDYPEDEYFFVPVRKKSMVKFMLLFPEQTDQDFVDSIDAFYDASLETIKRMRERRSMTQTQPKQQSQPPLVLEPPYVPARLNECAKELYH